VPSCRWLQQIEDLPDHFPELAAAQSTGEPSRPSSIDSTLSTEAQDAARPLGIHSLRWQVRGASTSSSSWPTMLYELTSRRLAHDRATELNRESRATFSSPR